MNKRKLFSILIFSIGITILGLLMDDDIKEPSTIIRFVEFFAMTGIIFVILTGVNYLINFVKNKVLISRN